MSYCGYMNIHFQSRAITSISIGCLCDFITLYGLNACVVNHVINDNIKIIMHGIDQQIISILLLCDQLGSYFVVLELFLYLDEKKKS